LGIVDRIIEGDLLSGAIAFACEVAGKPTLMTRERNEKLGKRRGKRAHLFRSA